MLCFALLQNQRIKTIESFFDVSVVHASVPMNYNLCFGIDKQPALYVTYIDFCIEEWLDHDLEMIGTDLHCLSLTNIDLLMTCPSLENDEN